MFPVNSTSVETPATKRTLRVIGRTRAAKAIAYAGVFDCRKIAGSASWSDHAFGAAADLFPRPPVADDRAQRHEIAAAVVYNATHRTVANRGRKLPIRYVIDHDALVIWTSEQGWHRYTGLPGDHVHVSDGPQPSGLPPCA